MMNEVLIQNLSVMKTRNNKIKGSVLAFTIFILVAITIFVSTILLQAGIVSFYQSRIIKTSNTISDIHTAINYLLYNVNNPNISGNELSSFLNDQDNPVTLLKNRWGFLNIIGATKQLQNREYQKSAFEGYTIQESDKYCLYLLEDGSPLSLCGNALLEGDAYIPRKGVKRGNLGNNSFTGDKLINGNIKISESMMPKVYHSTLDSVINFFRLQIGNSALDFITDMDGIEEEKYDFTDRARVIYNDTEISLNNIKLIGKYIIESEISVTIDASANLEDVIVKAPYIEINDGFKGTVQCIASDSIFIGENCNLLYPSVIALITENSPKSFRSVIISNSSSVNGLVFIAPDNLNRKSTLFTLNENARVIGQVYCNGLFEAKGEIIGNTICRNTILFTTSSIHENYLLNTRLIKNEQTHYLNILPGIFQESKKEILKWL
jgi:hypothetical protein